MTTVAVALAGVAAVPSVAEVRAQFGRVSSDPRFTGAGDSNGDGRVDALDLVIATRAASGN